MKKRTYTGTTNFKEQPYEIRHRKISKMAAQEGIVLLKNDNQILPIKKGSKLALYGAGAGKTIKGGTGSGDVNERNAVSIYEGLKNAGYVITTEKWIADYEKVYENAREAWKKEIWQKADAMEEEQALFNAYSTTQFQMPSGDIPSKTDADTAIYVLSRVAGEGADRHNIEGDYILTVEEEKILKKISLSYMNVILVLNVGGPIDLSFLDTYANIYGVLLISQPGMEAGNALAEVLLGTVSPSGKLTDTWTLSYEDHPSAKMFSHCDGNVEKEKYEEGIFVGYRYFDTFQIPVRYGFGYGLSYSDFNMEVLGVRIANVSTPEIKLIVDIKVRNVGKQYAGKEVVQVYVSCPQGVLEKEYRRLVGFQKTGLLMPGEEEILKIEVQIKELTSYCEETPGWILEAGEYGIFVGNSLEASLFEGTLINEETVILEKTEHICLLQELLEELSIQKAEVERMRQAWESKVLEKTVIKISKHDLVTDIVIYNTSYERLDKEAKEFVETLSTDQLILLATGDPGKGQGSNLGSSGISVPGSAAQTSSCALEQGLADIVLADGPAGLRLTKEYFVQDGNIVPQPFEASLEGGFLCRDNVEPEGKKWYQYCTAMPVGTLLAQSWNLELIEGVGKAVAEEMQQFQISLWLAPGMNIHRNPLCGRNFEYYSEDPLLTGKVASAMTMGVQSEYGCGTTIKHFACNNQEDNRMNTDSILSERALREIYLKGFEIAVKESEPFSIMTSYNLVNGIHAANNYDLCTKVARDEWKFKGVIMTDWTTTHYGPDCTASGCIRAGNDLIMPGIPNDHKNLRKELAEGTLAIEELKKSIAHLVSIIWKSNMYEPMLFR